MTRKGLIALFVALCISLTPIIPAYAISGSHKRHHASIVKRGNHRSVITSRSARRTRRRGNGAYRGRSHYRYHRGVRRGKGRHGKRRYSTISDPIVITPPYRVDLDNLPVTDSELTKIFESTTTAGTDGQLTIVIDAGHGGDATGAVARRAIVLTKKVRRGRRIRRIKYTVYQTFLTEKDVNLAVALKVRDLFNQLNDKLRARGFQHTFKVILTRDGDYSLTNPFDYGPDLQARVDVATREKADVFISIHHNGAESPGASGAEAFSRVYYYQKDPNDPNSTAVDETATATGILLASSLQKELTKAFGWAGVSGKDNGIDTANYWVLKRSSTESTETTTTITGVAKALTESAYMTNPGEADLLATDDFRTREAGGILYGTLVFLKQVLVRTGQL